MGETYCPPGYEDKNPKRADSTKYGKTETKTVEAPGGHEDGGGSRKRKPQKL